MSSPLDARIRHIAREVLAEAGGITTEVTADNITGSGDDPVAELERRLDALSTRVDELAKAAGDRARRAPRKTVETSE